MATNKNQTNRSIDTTAGRKPWEDNSGKVLPDVVLMEVSKSWSLKTWEEYLQSLEGGRREELARDFESLSLNHGAEEGLRNFERSEGTDDDDSSLAIADHTVHKEIYKLTHRQRTLIDLVYYQDMSVAEAAKTLGITAVAARGTLHRALARLKEGLTPILQKTV